MKRVILILAVVLAVGAAAYAQSVPQLINYQGILRQADGSLFDDGTYDILFRVYDDPDPESEESTLIWGETYQVMVVDGQFNVILGAAGGTPVGGAAVNDVAYAFTESNRYLGITVGTDAEILPRQQILSAPFALQAAAADNAIQADNATQADHADSATHADSASQADISLNNVPVGSIVAWHKSFLNTPEGTPQELPPGWVECNGQVLDMDGSPYNGQEIPNLNGPQTSISTQATKGYFLRGHTQSGDTEQDQSNHLDAVHTNGSSGAPLGVWVPLPENGAQVRTMTYYTSVDKDSMYFRLNGRETRPVAFSVVWIMRVK